MSRCLISGKEKHININKFAGLSRDWVGAKNRFMYSVFGSFLMRGKKHMNKIPPRIPGQSREHFVTLFPIVQNHQLQLHKELFRELFLLPGYNDNYMMYSSANYLRNNFEDHGMVFFLYVFCRSQLSE